MKRIGIYAGAFNPVHSGHVGFALQAIQEAHLDMVYFMPERKPRNKTGVEHYGHRIAMLKRACRPHPKCDVLESVEISFSVERTLPKLQKQFPDAQLVFLVGSDVAWGIVHWPNSQRLLEAAELIIGIRSGQSPIQLRQAIQRWPVQPKNLSLLASFAPDISSSEVREALRNRETTRGILASVARYSNRHWLYVSVG